MNIIDVFEKQPKLGTRVLDRRKCVSESLMNDPIVERLRKEASDPERYDRMIRAMRWSESVEELEKLTLLYVMDPSYPRDAIYCAHIHLRLRGQV